MRAPWQSRRPSRFLTAIISIATVLLAGTANAHEILPGVTGFASLLLHPFVAVETVLLMLGLAFVAGATESGRAILLACTVVVIGAGAGVMLQPSAIMVPGIWRLPLLLALVLGTVAATGRSAALPVLFILALLVSVVVGIAVPPERPGFEGRLETIAAVGVAILAVVLVIAVPRALLGRFRIVRLAGQVAGAWIFAIALLGMAIWFR
jgi:hydrogenase/urease accessory protein HupE